MLPNDVEGRAWVELLSDSNNPPEQTALITLLSSDDDLQVDVLGSAFVIKANGVSAICLGAAHSFHPVQRRQAWRSGKSNLKIPIDFLPKGPNYLNPEEITAFCVRDGVPHVCRVDQINYIENFDVALFTVYEIDGANIFNEHVAIDIGAPSVGENLIVMGNIINIEKRSDGKGVISQRFCMRMGVVTATEMGKGALPGISSYFETTIPLYGGMSGSPVIREPKKIGDPIVVVGVVSTDNSPSEAFEKFQVSGSSKATMLWPAMGLGLQVEIGNEVDTGHVFLGELVERSIIDNRSQNVTVKVRGDTERTEVLYEDMRSGSPYRVLLTTTGHPNDTRSK